MTYENFQDLGWVQKNYAVYHSSMVCKINGETVNSNQIRVRSMNFGQRWGHSEIVELRYTVNIPLVFAVDLMNSCLEDLYDDIRKYGVSSSLDEEMVKNAFPADVSGFISKQTEVNPFQNELIRFFEHDLLLRWFGDGASDQSPAFSINTINGFHVLDTTVQFEGICGKLM